MQPRASVNPSVAAASALALLLSLASGAIAHQSRHADRAGRRGNAPLSSRSATWTRGSTVRVPGLSSVQPVQEVRAMWVVRDSIESPERIRHVVETAKAFGFNTLFVQVRGRGDAWYDSSLEPRAEELANQPAGFDPLKSVIEQAHAAGIQVHAWVNTCYVWSNVHAPRSAEHIVNSHPDWLARDSSGSYHFTSNGNCEGAFLSPSNPQVRQHLHDVFLEIVKKYDIDGIHFDYIRYPNKGYDFSPTTLRAFAESIRPTLVPEHAAELDNQGSRAYVNAFPQRWADWRRDQVTKLVESVYKDTKDAKPWVCVSAAVYANWDDAYNERGQDWKRWLRDGALDAVIPMAYGASTQLVAQQIRDAENAAKDSGRACYAGIGSWHISAQSTAEKIAAARAAGVQGIVLFSYGGVTQDGATNNYLAKIDSWSFVTPAVLPHLASVAERSSAGVANATTPAAADSDAEATQASG